MSASSSDLATVGELARALGEREHRVAYILSSRRIEPE